MASLNLPPETAPWNVLGEELLALVRQLETEDGKPVNMIKFAEGYQSLARAYVRAIESEGRTSMRAQAVIKALDLSTPKSALLTFLGREELEEK